MDCAPTDLLQTLRVLHRAGERQPYAFDLTDAFSWRLERGRQAPSAAVRPDAHTGLEYTASVGVTGAREPHLPNLAGKSVQDGSVTLTAQPVSYASLRWRVKDADWSAMPADLVLSDQIETDLPGLQEVRIYVSGGIAGETYECPVKVTTLDDAVFICLLVVECVS